MGLTRFIKGDTIEMKVLDKPKLFKLLSDGYYNDEQGEVVCDIEDGFVSYAEMIEKDAKIISYQRRFKNF